MKNKDYRAFNSSLRPQSLKKQERIKDGTHKQVVRKSMDQNYREKMQKEALAAVNSSIAKGEIKKAIQLNLDRRLSASSRLATESSSTLARLDAELIRLHGQVIRLRATNDEGMTQCFICRTWIPYAESVNMHYQARKERGTRFSYIACQAGCVDCNNKPNGDRKNYARRLNEQYGEGTSSRADFDSKQLKRYDRLWYISEIDILKVVLRDMKKGLGL